IVIDAKDTLIFIDGAGGAELIAVVGTIGQRHVFVDIGSRDGIHGNLIEGVRIASNRIIELLTIGIQTVSVGVEIVAAAGWVGTKVAEIASALSLAEDGQLRRSLTFTAASALISSEEESLITDDGSADGCAEDIAFKSSALSEEKVTG